MSHLDPLDAYKLSYQEFYSEIPGSLDYLNDIDPEIQDEHETPVAASGLSAEQVSEIARDSMSSGEPSSPGALELFPDVGNQSVQESAS